MRGLYVENKNILYKMSKVEKLKYGLLVHASTTAILLVDFKRKISHLWERTLQVPMNGDYMIDS